MNLKETTVAIDSLLLDPNNYRFRDDPGFVAASESRFHEKSVQDKAAKRLRDEGLKDLKESIVTNGFLPVERIVVRPYPTDSSRYIVLEGNRRLAALRWVQEDHESGVEIRQDVLDTMKQVPVVVVPEDADPSFYESLMGIRHVSGIRQWGGYQSAKLVAKLRDSFGLEASEVGPRLGMSSHEVNRRYRAIKALEQMENDDDYGDQARPTMYPLFHEAVTWQAIKEWLDWSDSEWRFKNADQLNVFYDMITPTEQDDERPRPPKLDKREDVRDLKQILPHQDAKRILLDPSKTLVDALHIARKDELSRSWLTQVAEARDALGGLSTSQVKALTEEERGEVNKLIAIAEGLLADHKKLVSG